MYLLIIMEELVSNILISFDMSTNSTHMLYWIRLNNCQRLHISNFTRLPPNALHATIDVGQSENLQSGNVIKSHVLMSDTIRARS